MDSFQHTLNYDTNKEDQLNSDKDIEERRMRNLMQLADEFCVEKNVLKEDLEETGELQEDRRSDIKIEKLIGQYYMLLESLEFRMERHEQLAELAQKSIKLTLIDQENPKINLKK